MLEHGEKFLSCGASGLLTLLFSEQRTSVLCFWLHLSNRLLLLLWFGVSGENGFFWVSPHTLYLGLEHPFIDKPEVWDWWYVLALQGKVLSCHRLGSVGECWTALSLLWVAEGHGYVWKGVKIAFWEAVIHNICPVCVFHWFIRLNSRSNLLTKWVLWNGHGASVTGWTLYLNLYWRALGLGDPCLCWHRPCQYSSSLGHESALLLLSCAV